MSRSSRILVIGGTGFLGRAVVPRLIDAGHDVAVFHRAESTMVVADGARSIHGNRHDLPASASMLHAFAPDVVIDLILSSGRQAAALMDLFRGLAARVVAASSMDVYRATGVLHGFEEGPLEPLPLREESRLRTTPQIYPAAQVKMLQQVFPWLDEDYDKIPVERAVLGDTELPGTVLRLPMIYGPGDALHRFFPILKRMDDRRPALVFPRTVAEWRSPRGYVENVAAAVALAATTDRARGRIYNVAEVESFSELGWARLLAEATGWDGEFVVVDDDDAPPSVRVPGNLAQHWVADTTRIRTELGYREPIGREGAIRRTIAWEREHPPATVDRERFDYEAEDAAARRARAKAG